MRKILNNLLILCLILLAFSACQKSKESQQFIDFAAIDSSIRPQDDFFHFANGNWLKNTEIPASESGWGSFYILAEKSTKDLHSLLEELASESSKHKKGSVAQLTADLYKSGMDSLTIEQLGIEPLKEDLDKIENINEPYGVINEVTREITSGSIPLAYGFIPGHYIVFYVYQDDKNSEKMLAHFDQGDLGLPTKDYYFSTDSTSVAIREAYLQYISKFFELMGVEESQAQDKAKRILELETKLADASKNPVELRDPIANYNKFAVSELDSTMPGLKWPSLIEALGIETDTVLMGQPKYYQALNEQIYATPLDTWKDLLTYWLVRSNASALSSQFVNNQFDFYGRTLQGQKEMKPRWKRLSQSVDQLLRDALGQLYVAKFFPPEAKQKMDKLVENLLIAYEARITQTTWMSDSTKEKALEKLHAITRKIGYPDKWDQYKGLNMEPGKFLVNLKNARKYAYNKMTAKLGKPVDPTEWLMTPPTVNAYYNPNRNEIVFPAGILQPPFFNKDADDAINYGAIGVVIAHEVTHGFDDKGRLFDSKGNLNEWWTKEDAERYQEQANKIIEQFGNYTVLDGLHLNGELTQGENIADLGGLMIAYDAFKRTKQGQSEELIDGLTPDQRFFLSYAKVWQIKTTDESLRQQVLTDPHSPSQYRINGPLTNVSAFYKAFNVQPGDKLYQPDSLHIKIW